MMTTLGIVVPLYLMYATKIHSKEDIHAELLSQIFRNVFIPKPLGNINTTTKAYIMYRTLVTLVTGLHSQSFFLNSEKVLLSLWLYYCTLQTSKFEFN